MTSYVNIGGDKSDASYRYKMPVMQLKTEGKGNGIKTIILNIKDIAKSLNVDIIYPVKFFGIELGAQTKLSSDNRCVINGSHNLYLLSQCLDTFIKRFVLCEKCGLPELIWKVSHKNSCVKIRCLACGNSSSMKDTHKLVNYIIKNPPSQSQSSHISPQKSSQIKDRDRDDKEQENEEDEEEDTEEKKDSLKSLKDLIDRKNSLGIIYELRLLALSRGLSEVEKYKLLLDVMIDKNFLKNLDIKILKEIVKSKSEKLSLFCAIEQVLSQGYISYVPLFFHTLYEADLFDEDFFICWYDSCTNPSMSKSAKNFIEWLKKDDD